MQTQFHEQSLSGDNTPDNNINLSIGKTSFFIPQDYLIRLSEVIVLGDTDGCEGKIRETGVWGETTDATTITNLNYSIPSQLITSSTGTNTGDKTANAVTTKPCITTKLIIYAVLSSVENIFLTTNTNSISDLPSNSGDPFPLNIADASATRCDLFFIQAQPLFGEKIFVNKIKQVTCI